MRSATTRLTGFYGSEYAEASLSATVNTNTQNNSSILFGGRNNHTLSLTTDGKTANHTKSKIIFSTSDTNPVDVSSLLGESAGALTLTLDPSQFSVGDKFVYNVSGNGTTQAPSDTSLYLNSDNGKVHERFRD